MLPSWNLVIVVLFIVCVAYNMIIGLNKTWKIMFSTYVSILVADAIGSIMARVLSEDVAVRLFNLNGPEELVAIVKIFIFASAIVLFTTKGKFNISTGSAESSFMKMSMSLTAAVLSATLIIATIMTYLFGNSLIEGMVSVSQTGTSIQEQSTLANLMANNYSTIFALPAIAFIITSLGWREE